MLRRLSTEVGAPFAPKELVLFVFMGLIAAGGCGSDGPFSYVRVSGKVTYEDGSPIPGSVRVAFISQSEGIDGQHPRPAYGFTDDNGEFPHVTSQKSGDGIVPGQHKVLIVYEAPNADRVIPKEYTREKTTPLTVDASDAPFEFKIRRP